MTEQEADVRHVAQMAWERAASRFMSLVKTGTLDERIAAADQLEDALQVFLDTSSDFTGDQRLGQW